MGGGSIGKRHLQYLKAQEVNELALVQVNAERRADLDLILQIAERRGLVVIEDACHALGAEYRGRRLAGIAHMTVFSFHPVKHLTTGEGGMVTTNNRICGNAAPLPQSRHQQRKPASGRARASGTTKWSCWVSTIALRILPARWVSRNCRSSNRTWRGADKSQLDASSFSGIPAVVTPGVRSDAGPAWHLYPIRS